MGGLHGGGCTPTYRAGAAARHHPRQQLGIQQRLDHAEMEHAKGATWNVQCGKTRMVSQVSACKLLWATVDSTSVQCQDSATCGMPASQSLHASQPDKCCRYLRIEQCRCGRRRGAALAGKPGGHPEACLHAGGRWVGRWAGRRRGAGRVRDVSFRRGHAGLTGKRLVDPASEEHWQKGCPRQPHAVIVRPSAVTTHHPPAQLAMKTRQRLTSSM